MGLKKTLLAAACVAAFVVASAVAASAQGVNADYLPFPRSMLRRFPLKRVEAPPGLRGGQPFEVSGVTMREVAEDSPAGPGGGSGGSGESEGGEEGDEGESARVLVFSGLDAGGRAWELKTDSWIHYEAAYVGDLDRNGVRDLVLAIGTGANGLGEPTHLIFLTFDRAGRPTLFEATGYFDPRQGDIFDLADLDGDRRAELLHMVYDDGYWVTNVYRVADAAWGRVRGRFAGMNFPLYTRFTRRPNHRPVRPAGGRNPHAPDLLEPGRAQ